MQKIVLERELETAGSTEEDNFDSTIDQAMAIAGVSKAVDLFEYIPHENENLSKETFLRMQETNRRELVRLIKENILDKVPQKYPSPQAKGSSSPTSVINKFVKLKSETTKGLNEAIDQAMKKLKTDKEKDLCLYIPYDGKRLHHFTYNRLKIEQPKTLQKLITEHVLSKEPQKYERSFKLKEGRPTSPSSDSPIEEERTSLNATIDMALRRRSLKLKNEEDICRYIPQEKGFLHPMAFRSLKKKDPAHLKAMIEEHVMKPTRPILLQWNRKKSAAAQPAELEGTSNLQISSQEKEVLSESNKMDQLIAMVSKLVEEIQTQKTVETKELAKESHIHTEDTDIISTPNQSNFTIDRYLRTIQNQLIKRIRQREVDYELWDAFVDLVEKH